MKKITFFATLFILLAFPCGAEDKSWNAAGDQSNWFDDANWYPAPVPTVQDDVKVDMLDASANVGQSFEARSITLGGKKSSSLAVGNFVFGSVRPTSGSDVAIANRRDGLLTMRGSAGRTVLKGSYKSSKQLMDEEPSYLFFLE